MNKTEYLGCFSASEGRIRIELNMLGTEGRGLCGFLTGGDKSHTGGVVYASPRPKSRGEGLTADVSTICGYGHKDAYAAQGIAKRICTETGESVSITAGIHVDGASDEELMLIGKLVSRTADEFLRAYLKGGKNSDG